MDVALWGLTTSRSFRFPSIVVLDDDDEEEEEEGTIRPEALTNEWTINDLPLFAGSNEDIYVRRGQPQHLI